LLLLGGSRVVDLTRLLVLRVVVPGVGRGMGLGMVQVFVDSLVLIGVMPLLVRWEVGGRVQEGVREVLE